MKLERKISIYFYIWICCICIYRDYFINLILPISGIISRIKSPSEAIACFHQSKDSLFLAERTSLSYIDTRYQSENTLIRCFIQKKPHRIRPPNFYLFAESQLIVHFSSKAEYTNNPLKYISYCHNCQSPEQEGSVIYALNAKYGLKEYRITGELIYSVPNQAENPIINNSDYLHNRIVFVDRGKVALLDKILRIQDQSAAAAIIIAEVNGDCDDAFRSCGSSSTQHIGQNNIV